MENELNENILNWWHQLPNNLRGNMPTFIHPLNRDAEILFVGLNPAGDTATKVPIEKICEKDIKIKIANETKVIFGEGQNREGQYKRYYRALTSIADELKVDFEHCDLFHMSYRTARTVVDELLDENRLIKEIHLNHLKVFEAIYDYVSPKVVITNNVVSADILRDYLKLQFDTNTGLYISKIGTYFFLNGIMSYGRQTKYDRERLIWQIRKVL